MSETKALKRILNWKLDPLANVAMPIITRDDFLNASAELDALLAENEQLKNHAVPFAVLTNENELLTADNALRWKQLDEAMDVIEDIHRCACAYDVQDAIHIRRISSAFLKRMKKEE